MLPKLAGTTPISSMGVWPPIASRSEERRVGKECRSRSEERRVGKECRSRWYQIEVLPTLQSVSDESIFSLGDCAACPIQGTDGKRVPPRSSDLLTGKPLRKCVYRDYGTLVSLPSLSAVGTLMGKLSGTTFVEGLLARMFYLSLYRMHQVALLGKRRVILKTCSQSRPALASACTEGGLQLMKVRTPLALMLQGCQRFDSNEAPFTIGQ